MSVSNQDCKADIEAIHEIASIPALLNVVCHTTVLGFAAIARVTENRWITCSVKDDISIGLYSSDRETSLSFKMPLKTENKDENKI